MELFNSIRLTVDIVPVFENCKDYRINPLLIELLIRLIIEIGSQHIIFVDIIINAVIANLCSDFFPLFCSCILDFVTVEIICTYKPTVSTHIIIVHMLKKKNEYSQPLAVSFVKCIEMHTGDLEKKP